MKRDLERMSNNVYDVLIIGGSDSGIVKAITGKSNYPKKDFLIIRGLRRSA